MRSQVTRKMPFTEEQMQKIYNTNIIDFAREHGFEVEKGDKATLHVKNSGGFCKAGRYGKESGEVGGGYDT